MGILDDLLAGATSGQGGGLPTQRPQRGAGGGPNAALLALLPIVLSMLANRGASAAAAAGMPVPRAAWVTSSAR